MEMNWIHVDTKLPNNKEKVIILTNDSGIQVAVFEQGRKEGEYDPYKGIQSSDEFGNNLKPYCWENSPNSWFGQQVSYWMPLPDRLPNIIFNEFQDVLNKLNKTRMEINQFFEVAELIINETSKTGKAIIKDNKTNEKITYIWMDFIHLWSESKDNK